MAPCLQILDAEEIASQVKGLLLVVAAVFSSVQRRGHLSFKIMVEVDGKPLKITPNL